MHLRDPPPMAGARGASPALMVRRAWSASRSALGALQTWPESQLGSWGHFPLHGASAPSAVNAESQHLSSKDGGALATATRMKAPPGTGPGTKAVLKGC